MRRIIPFTALALALLALPALAADGAPDEARANSTPATVQSPDVLPLVDQAPLFTTQIGNPEDQAGCSGWARCADGSTVSCSSEVGTCWGLDNCYAVCNGVMHWCSYRPYPCPI